MYYTENYKLWVDTTIIEVNPGSLTHFSEREMRKWILHAMKNTLQTNSSVLQIFCYLIQPKGILQFQQRLRMLRVSTPQLSEQFLNWINHYTMTF